MKTEQWIYNTKGWVQKSDSGISEVAQLVFLFGNRELLKNSNRIEEIKQKYPKAHLVGCSTSGEIFNTEVLEKSIVSTAVFFEKGLFRIASEKIENPEDSFYIGEKLGKALLREDLIHVLVISDGLHINGSELTKGLKESLAGKVSVTGGLAGDEAAFLETVVVNNAAGAEKIVLAIGFYGDHLKIGYGSQGGWSTFGVDRQVTRAKGNILYELDGQPALQLYKKYLGDYAAQLPSSALLFPLSLRGKNNDTSLVRTILSVNETDGSMTFAGDIPEGDYVRLMNAGNEKLIDGATGAAEMAMESLTGTEPDLAILISCVGRKLVLKQRTEEEIESVTDQIGGQATITGFYSYGEICPTKPFELDCELHNQTMTITLIKELIHE